MKLGLNEIASLSCGAAYTEIISGAVVFHRFSREQEEVYRTVSPDDFFVKAHGTAGVKLAFTTDSTSLTLAVRCEKASSRLYFSHDVKVDGKLIGSLANFKDEDMTGDYSLTVCTLGDFVKTFALGGGEKNVEVLLPWSCASAVTELSLDDGSHYAPAPKAKKLLAYGDSITHGYDVLHTANRYAALLADHLGADEYNRAIAAEIFRPELAAADPGITPDIITVAYGTNDWALCSRSTFIENCTGFYAALRRAHPGVPIYAITPIWRADMHCRTAFGDFEDTAGVIADICASVGGITVLNGRHYLPADPALYGDLELHPNDEGNIVYFEGIKRDME